MTDELHSARLKLKRAERHLKSLQSKIGRFVEDRAHPPLGVREHLETDDHGREWKVTRCEVVRPTPEEWSLILGDFVQNTRAALDHLVCALVRLNNGKPTNRNAFPILREGRKRDKARLRTALEGVHATHANSIEEMQPYRKKQAARSRRLLVLQRLSNLDKHRLVHSNVQGMPRVTDDGYWQRGEGLVRFPKTPTARPGKELMRVSADPGHHLQVQLLLGCDIVFGSELIRSAELPALRSEAVAIIDEFVPAFAPVSDDRNG